MIVIGERINGMFQDVKRAISAGDKQLVQSLAAKQTEAGANYLDVNVGARPQQTRGGHGVAG